MGLVNSFRLDHYLKAPVLADPDRNLAARQIFTIVRAFILSSVFLQLVQLAVAPRITARWLTLLLATLAVSLALLELNRRGHVRPAGFLLVLSLWLLFGIFAWTASGLGARAAWGYFIVVFIAGMILGRWMGIVAAAICSASTMFIALAAPVLSPDPVRFWLINTLYLVIVLLLQELAGRSIRESLARAHSELHERQLAESDTASRARRRIRIMFKSRPIVFSPPDMPSLRFTLVNQAVLPHGSATANGRAPDACVFRMSPIPIIPQTTGKRHGNCFDKRSPSTKPRSVISRKGSGIVWGSVTVSVIRNRDDEFLNFLVMVEDITARKQAETEREQIISLLKATIESTADGILVIDNAGKITDFNQRFAQLWRIPAYVLADSRR